MYYIIYKTINLINNHFYIGKHQCSKLEDGYLGSGKRLIQALKKYGRSNFKREILFIFDNELDMNNKEKELVIEELLSNPNCYNLTLGGEGGPIFLGKHHSEETKKKLREIGKTRRHPKKTSEQLEDEHRRRLIKNNGQYFSEETKRKISESLKRHYEEHPEKVKHRPRRSKEEANKSRSESLKGHSVSEETKKKLSDALKNIVPTNKGKIQINNGIENKYISQEELEEYLSKGWTRGRYQTKR